MSTVYYSVQPASPHSVHIRAEQVDATMLGELVQTIADTHDIMLTLWSDGATFTPRFRAGNPRISSREQLTTKQRAIRDAIKAACKMLKIKAIKA